MLKVCKKFVKRKQMALMLGIYYVWHYKMKYKKKYQDKLIEQRIKK